MKNKSTQIIITLLLYPLLALPVIIREIYNKKYYALSFLAIFMGLIAYLWIPSGDLYRFYLQYDLIKEMNFIQVVAFSELDIVMQLLTWLFSKTGLNYEWFRFITCVFCYLLVFSVTKSIIANNRYGHDKKISFIIFCIIFGLLRFTIFLTGARFPIGIALVFYAQYQFLSDRGSKFRGWLALIAATFTHFSFAPILIIFFLTKIIKLHWSKPTLLILYFISYLLSSFALVYVISRMNLEDSMSDHLDAYTTGYQADGELANHSFLFRLAQIFSIFAFYVLTILSFFRVKNFKECPAFAMTTVFIMLLINMNTAYNRYAYIAVFLILPYFLLNPSLYFKIKDLKIMLYVSIFVFISSIWTFRRELTYGDQYYIATPTYMILSHTYTDSWIQNNIARNGNMIKNE